MTSFTLAQILIYFLSYTTPLSERGPWPGKAPRIQKQPSKNYISSPCPRRSKNQQKERPKQPSKNYIKLPSKNFNRECNHFRGGWAAEPHSPLKNYTSVIFGFGHARLRNSTPLCLQKLYPDLVGF